MSNWFEDTLATVAPRYALRRAQARLALDSVRAYEAAAQNRHTSGWKATGASVNDEVGSGFTRVRNRAREMVRNNEWTAAAVRKKTTAIVGTGVIVTPADPQEAKLWNAWCNSTSCDPEGRLTFAAICRLAVRTWQEGGEAVIRQRLRRPGDGMDVPLQLQVLEGDYIDDSKISQSALNFTLMGVEFNAIGQRTRYWMHRNHPGDSISMRGLQESVPVPASSVIHLFDATRPGQVRGMSELAVALLRARKTGDYEYAIQLRKQVEACFSAFVTTDDPQTTIAGASLDPADQSKPRREKLAAGLITYLKSGEQVAFATPQSSSGEDAFLTYQLRAMAAGYGIPYEVLTGDLSKANFSSNRMGWVEYQLHTEELQWLVLVPQLILPVRQWFRDAMVLAGLKPGAEPDMITMPAKPWIKPTEDVTAAADELSAGLTTYGEKLRERGWSSFDAFLVERAREEKALKGAGLSFGVQKAAAPAAQAEPAANSADSKTSVQE